MSKHVIMKTLGGGNTARCGARGAGGDVNYQRTDKNAGKKLRPHSSPVRGSPERAEGGGGAGVGGRPLSPDTSRAFFHGRPPATPLSLCAAPHTVSIALLTQVTVATETPTFPLPRKKHASRNRRRVRSILQELVACLPLRPVPTPSHSQSHQTAPTIDALCALSTSSLVYFPENQWSLMEDDALVRMSAARSPEHVPERAPEHAREHPSECTVMRGTRTTGTQAIIPDDTVGEPFKSTAEERAARAQLAEWAGPARALRDAHVRLALRQLRQLRTLNRALDHAAAAVGLDAPLAPVME